MSPTPIATPTDINTVSDDKGGLRYTKIMLAYSHTWIDEHDKITHNYADVQNNMCYWVSAEQISYIVEWFTAWDNWAN